MENNEEFSLTKLICVSDVQRSMEVTTKSNRKTEC